MSYHAANVLRQVMNEMGLARQLNPNGNEGLEERMDDAFGPPGIKVYPPADMTGIDGKLPRYLLPRD